jgi:predicted ATP-grasp superfamily ATP-dependent carboligase/chaperonin cofactor prefoldin
MPSHELERDGPSLNQDLETLEHMNHTLGERLIALENEMTDRLQSHTDEMHQAQSEINRLRTELENRVREATRLQDEVKRLMERGDGLEAELALATTAPGRSVSTWRVLVLDASSPSALSACRSLGRAGHDVGVASSTPRPRASYSRFTSRCHQLPGPHAREESFQNALNALIAGDGYEVLVVLDDATLARLRRISPSVPCFPSLGPGFDRLTDKIGLIELADEADVAYPTTFATTSEWDVDDAIASVGLPVVVKAARSAVAAADGVHHHEGATVANDHETALAAFSTFRGEGLTPIVQEFVHRREKINLSIFRRGGRSEVRFTYRVLRDVPLSGGVAMAVETIPSDRGIGFEAVEALERLCDAAGYDGLANGEFCRAPDGRLYLIEVNPRLWGSTWFAERLGQRVVERGVRLALGLPALPDVDYPEGRRFHHLAGELRWLRLHRSRLGPLRELLRTTRPWDVFDGDELSDPKPIIRDLTRGAGHPRDGR